MRFKDANGLDTGMDAALEKLLLYMP